MCVGFLYTVLVKVLLGSGESRMSWKGKASSFLGSMVNCMCGSCELICWSSC